MYIAIDDIKSSYDVIVVGGGNAGIEAGTASARIGAKTLIITFSYKNLGTLSCNPSIGGIGKGTVVREIDALDGVMAKVTDASSINRKNLNSSKGPAVWGPRHQIDRELYKKAMFNLLSDYENLDIVECQVYKILVNDSKKKSAIGVELSNGKIIKSKSIVCTTGTFLNGITIIGDEKVKAGRINEPSSIELANSIHSLGLSMTRLKTGTPCRLHKDSINYDNLDIQVSDINVLPMSYMNDEINIKQLDCYITYTNEKSHKIIQDGWERIPAVNGDIKYNGPRYCPSIETKIQRFSERNRHHIFLEPEGLNSDLIYPNGISTSMPKDMQESFIHSIKGLEKAKIMQYGYAIEYDLVDPRELKQTLETKKIDGLFLAGQIIGTTGYEEAGGLGCIAGINAALKASTAGSDVLNDKIFTLSRDQSYIGVMIDDITTVGVGFEPYRLFTSRSEYRLTCRADNADFRLTKIGYDIGCVSDERYSKFSELFNLCKKTKEVFKNRKIATNEFEKIDVNINNDGITRTAYELLSYPKVNVEKIFELCGIHDLTRRAKENIIFDSLYDKYAMRQQTNIEEMRRNQHIKIPVDFNYRNIKCLSNEEVEKLERTMPETMHQLSRIAGITPTSVFAILEKIKNKN